MNKKKDPKIRIDCTAGGYLVNRWVARCHKTIYYTRGTLAENVPIKHREFYKIQWQNIGDDIKDYLLSPNVLAQTDPNYWIRGAIAFDAAAQTSHSGEPSTITWSHTIGSGANRFININVSGLSATNASQWDGNATTAIVSTGSAKSAYYLAPATGVANCTADGGNIKVGGSISFEEVDQADPIGASTSENGSSSPNDMSLTTDTDNSFRVDVLGANKDNSTDPTGSLDSGDLRHNDIVPQNQFRIGLFGYTNFQATAGADTHQWTTDAFNRYYLAFEVHEAVAASVKDLLGSGIVVFPR